MNVSIAAYSFHGLLAEGCMDAFGYLETVRYRYDLHTADIWNGILASTDEDYVRKVRRAVDERELTVVNYHADGPHAWDPDPDVRERNHALALEHLRVAETLGAATVRIDTGGEVRAMTDAEFDVVAGRYAKYCAWGRERGVRVGPENHWGFSLLAGNLDRLARAVDSPAFGILLHIGHWEQGDEDAGDRFAAPLAMHTHVDARITAESLEPKMRLLRDAGYDRCWGVEHHSAANEYREVEFQLAAVRRALAR